MKAAEFKDWIKSIELMSRGQRDKLRERLEGRAGVDTILELIEQRQNDERICPYCQGTKLYRWGKASELQRYRCRHCNHTFNPSLTSYGQFLLYFCLVSFLTN